ncbi:MAG: DNA mismatch repair protein MutS [Methylococcales bacterium]|nr:DNA mismatch repair protein MutS [Methylococcales bacterium]
MTQTILEQWRETSPDPKISRPLPTGDGVLDSKAFDTVEVDALFDSINHCQTRIGQAVLYRSLCQPLAERSAVLDKQQAFQEIQDKPDLKQALQQLIDQAATDEPAFYRLLFGEFLGAFGTSRHEHEIEGFGYLPYRRGINLLLNAVTNTHQEALDATDSPYLQTLLTRLQDFSRSRAHALMQGPVYISERGIQAKTEHKKHWSPALIFTPRIFKPVLIGLIALAIWAVLEFFPSQFFNISADSVAIGGVFFFPLLLIYFPIVGGFDRDNAIIPLRDIYRGDADVAQALDTLGQIDELLALVQWSDTFASKLTLPELLDADHHQIELTQAKNPVLAKDNPDYVGNDLQMVKQRLILITGPNSGGKTAFCKTLTQIQLLAQIGAPIPATRAVMTVADRIFYQAPEISHLDDGEGRFGAELKRTRDIFIASSKHSLIALDELSEGTTFEEKLEASLNVLEGFYRKGCSILLITHNHQLVDELLKRGMGEARMVEFLPEGPTYKLIPGISRVSHADRVAEKVGFSKAHIEKLLQQP